MGRRVSVYMTGSCIYKLPGKRFIFFISLSWVGLFPDARWGVWSCPGNLSQSGHGYLFYANVYRLNIEPVGSFTGRYSLLQGIWGAYILQTKHRHTAGHGEIPTQVSPQRGAFLSPYRPSCPPPHKQDQSQITTQKT